MEINIEKGYWNYFQKDCEKEQDEIGIKSAIKVRDYVGQKNLVLTCTQLDCSQTEQAKIVNEWCELFTTQQLPIEKIWIKSRISQKILDAICNQTNLKGVFIKWGVYQNIFGLENLKNIEYLHLGGGASIENIETVGKLKKLKTFEASHLYKIQDYDFMKYLNQVVDLTIEGDPYSSMKKVTLKSLEFLKDMPQLIRLELCMTKIEDNSYLPIAELPNLKYLGLPVDKDLDKDIHKFEKYLK